MRERAPRVSVVVPVFDAGPYIEPAIRSILGQTLPAGEIEAIFVDDGSTDGTPARLDRLAAEHPETVKIIHIAASGSPGRPRNIGLAAARGEYVQFLDADDELAPDALERLVAMADRNESDIVVEKFASASIPRSQALFTRSIERTTLAETPTLVDSSLGPAKLFRRSFLLANEIVFPEGWRQMEDQYLAIQAYARAGSIAVCADRPSYFFLRRDDGAHLTAERLDPDRHFRDLRTVLDLVARETEPGSVRDVIVGRLLRIEVLRKVSEPVYPGLPEDDRARWFAGARDLLRERIDPAVVERLGAIQRLRCELLTDDRPDELLALAERLEDLELTATLARVGWDHGAFRITADARLTFRSTGGPLVVHRGRDGSTLDATLGAGVAGHRIDLAASASRPHVRLILRARPSILEWYLTARTSGPGDRSTDAGDGALSVAATARALIDPLRVGAGDHPIDPGAWDLVLRFAVFGIERSAPLLAPSPGAFAAAASPALLGDPARVVVPVVEPAGLRLEVDPPPAVLARALEGRPMRVVSDGARLVLELPMAAGPSAGDLPVELVVRTPGRDVVLPARLRPHPDGVVLDAPVAGSAVLPVGSCMLLLRLGGREDAADVPVGGASVNAEGRIRVDGLERIPAGALVAASVRRPFVRLASTIVTTGRRIEHRLRPPAGRLFRRLRGRRSA